MRWGVVVRYSSRMLWRRSAGWYLDVGVYDGEFEKVVGVRE